MTTTTETDGLVEALRSQARSYHDQHPFHVRMNAGRLSRRQIQGWVANRYYYQENIPRKDAAILANCPDLEVRRRWIRRIIDHDGTASGEGGIEAWLRLGEAVGLTREEVADGRHLVPGVRFAVDAYVTFARTKPWVEAVASSLTELFAPDLMAERLAAFERHYTSGPGAGGGRPLVQVRRALERDGCNRPSLCGLTAAPSKRRAVPGSRPTSG
jgi:pyrroloquinoline-quinone synthase